MRRRKPVHTRRAAPVQPAPERRMNVPEPESRPLRPLEEAYAPPLTLGRSASAAGMATPMAGDAALTPTSAPALSGPVKEFFGACEVEYLARPFIGYAMCADLMQDGLMQAGVETVADEMTRKFIELAAPNETVKKRLEAELQRLDVRGVFNRAAAWCGYFGGCLVYMDTGDAPEDLAKPIALTPEFIAQGSLRGLRLIEPVVATPGWYNSSDPLAADYFEPRAWYVQSTLVDASRLLVFRQNTPPLLLKAAYNFFGVPAVQIALDYVAHFTQTRESAAKLLKKFSTTVFKTDISRLLYGGDAAQAKARIGQFAAQRDNDGVAVLDYESEAMEQLNTPLSGVDVIVRQALELLAVVWRIPAVKLFGISPAGLNATGESDMQNFYDFIASRQGKVFAAPLERLLKVVQLSVAGAVDPAMTYSFVPLWEMTAREKADRDKVLADTDAVYLDRGVISEEEARNALAAQPGGRYAGIDPGKVPPMPQASIRDPDYAGGIYA